MPIRTRALLVLSCVTFAAAAACGSSSTRGNTATTNTVDGGADAQADSIKTVFLIMMENHNWPTVVSSGTNSAYITGTLVPMGGHAEQYYTPPGVHPSSPNYIWLEAGDNLAVVNDNPPSSNHQSTTEHLTTQLEAAGISWKAYAEGVKAGACPLTASGDYDPKHTPQLYFDDVTDKLNANSAHCKDHVRDYSELIADLAANTVARYNFIAPSLCNDMHGELSVKCPYSNDAALIKGGNDWLAMQIPKILASQAYKDNGVIFIIWDEGDEAGVPLRSNDGPMGLLVLSPLAKPNFTSKTRFTHSSTLRTVQTIFGVPYLRGAQTSNDLSEFFNVAL